MASLSVYKQKKCTTKNNSNNLIAIMSGSGGATSPAEGSISDPVLAPASGPNSGSVPGLDLDPGSGSVMSEMLALFAPPVGRDAKKNANSMSNLLLNPRPVELHPYFKRPGEEERGQL